MAMLSDDSSSDVTSTGAGQRVATYLHGVDHDGLAIERDALTAAFGGATYHVQTPEQLVRVLDPATEPAQMLVTSVHGNGRPGLAHSLQLAPGRALSAARMLTLRFPPTVVISACLSAEIDERRGTAPIGIPTVALCRGANTVIGGIFPLPDGPSRRPQYSHATATLLELFYPLLAQCVPAPAALRLAQREWRRERSDPPPLLWAGLVAITTQLTGYHS